MIDYVNLLLFSFLDKLGFFLKLIKNSITFVISNIFIFKVNFAIDKNNTQNSRLFFLFIYPL